jgi:hypothetical protein
MARMANSTRLRHSCLVCSLTFPPADFYPCFPCARLIIFAHFWVGRKMKIMFEKKLKIIVDQ